MAKYQEWNQKLINKQFEESVNDENFLLDYYVLNQIIQKNIIIFPPASFSDEKEITNLFSIFKNDILKFNELRPLTKDFNNTEFRTTELKNSLIISFTHDFYASLIDKDFVKAFQKIFKERKNNLKFSNDRSIELYLPNRKYAYIRTRRNNTIEDIANIIHEYAHAISDEINFHINSSEYPFIELPSLFFTLLAMDKLDDAFIGLYKEILKYKKIEIGTIGSNAKNIITFEEIVDNHSELDFDLFRKILKKEYHLSKMETEFFMQLSNLERYSYVIPYLVVIELYYLYKTDPELALFKLKELIKINSSDNYKKELDKLDINLNEHSEVYIRSLKK